MGTTNQLADGKILTGYGQLTKELRWFIPAGMPADYPPILQQLWIITSDDGVRTEEWQPLPVVRGE